MVNNKMKKKILSILLILILSLTFVSCGKIKDDIEYENFIQISDGLCINVDQIISIEVVNRIYNEIEFKIITTGITTNNSGAISIIYYVKYSDELAKVIKQKFGLTIS